MVFVNATHLGQWFKSYNIEHNYKIKPIKIQFLRVYN